MSSNRRCVSVFLLVPTGRAGLESLPEAAEIERIFEDMAELVGNAPFAVDDDGRTSLPPAFLIQQRGGGMARSRRG